MAISRVTIPRVAHNKLLETCMFHATRKRGSCKHVTGIFKDLSWCNACKNEIIFERYHINWISVLVSGSWVLSNPVTFFNT